MNFVKTNWKGFLLCLIIALPSWLLGKQFPIIGGPVIAILLGMILTLFIKDKTQLEAGIKFTSKKILQYAVILLGFGLNLNVILETSRQSLSIILATITPHWSLPLYCARLCIFRGRFLPWWVWGLPSAVVLPLLPQHWLLMRMMRRLPRLSPLFSSLTYWQP